VAYGLTDAGGVMAPADVIGAGEAEWARTSGIAATHPLVGGPSWGSDPFDPDRGRSRIVTTSDGAAGPATGGIMAPAGELAQLDDWRDLFNFRGSPMPWLLVLALVMVGFMELRVQARAGGARASAAIG
jgi:hypothetical protein